LRIAYKVFTRSAGNCGAFHIDDKGANLSAVILGPRIKPEDDVSLDEALSLHTARPIEGGF